MDSGQILLKHGLLNETDLARAEEAITNGQRVDQAAIALGIVSEADVLQAWGEEVGMRLVDLEKTEVDTSLLSGFPAKLIHRHGLFPISRHNGAIVIATSDPLDLYSLDEAGAALGVAVEPVLATRASIANRVTTYLGVGSETIEGLLAQRQEEEDIELLGDINDEDGEIDEEAQEASVVTLVNQILIEAIDSRTSDVHIESQPSGIKIRYRIDGILHAQPVPQEINQFQAAIISRLKIMSRLNIAEKRLPQDGRIKLKVHGREVDVRVSVIPMLHGESIVMRLLDKGSMNFSLEKLGMELHIKKQFDELIRLPHGIVLVTGPT
ncbi:MAG: Flp pilus assembly complex ATPase component TadA, partial [Planctomycetales bacterium]|nr:Flp pilus assembly complex ATPase component TadA [Planctomycetales bacterium]